MVIRAGIVFVVLAAAQAQGPGYKEIANTGQLMQGLIQPASSAIAEAAKDQGPQDNRAWRTALTNAVILQEGAQLLLVGSRAKDQDGWVKASNTMADAAAAVQKAAQAKDVAGFQAASKDLGTSCQGCHSVYRMRGGGKKQ